MQVSEFVHQDIRDMYSSRRPAHGERAEGRCSTQEENDVRMERDSEKVRDGEPNISLR